MSKAVLNEDNFLLYAAKHYDSPGCTNIQEFYEDLNRFKYIKKLFKRYKSTGDLKERLILNHIIILNNIFGVEAATRMMFFRLEKYEDCLKPFLLLMGTLPERLLGIGKEDAILRTTDIVMDTLIVERLRVL